VHSSRRWPRIDLALRVKLSFENVSGAADSQTIDISRQGLFVRLAQPKPIGTKVRVEVRLGTGERLEVEGVVVRVVPDPEDKNPDPAAQPGMGVFLTTAGEAWMRFVEALETQRLENTG
jgi:molecular chaperone DnaK